MPTVMPPRQVTAPSSGSSLWSMSCSSVDLPSPFLPTMPMRSPSFTPIVTSASTRLPGHSCERCSQPIRIPISLLLRAVTLAAQLSHRLIDARPVREEPERTDLGGISRQLVGRLEDHR